MFDASLLLKSAKEYLKVEKYTPSYGTAGFRAEASLLPCTMYRCGVFAAIRSLLKKRNTGVMITASHNPVADNGVKLIEPTGENLPQDLEPIVTKLVNSNTEDELLEAVRTLLSAVTPSTPTPTEGEISKDKTSDSSDDAFSSSNELPVVFLGHDTRPSAQVLVAAARAGVESLGVNAVVCGHVTTPQLHFLVSLSNFPELYDHDRVDPETEESSNVFSSEAPASKKPRVDPESAEKAYGENNDESKILPRASASEPSPRFSSEKSSLFPPNALAWYYRRVATAYRRLTLGAAADGDSCSRLFVDCANGVGARMFQPLIAPLAAAGLELLLRNAGVGKEAGNAEDEGSNGPMKGVLNHLVGADFVQKELVVPQDFEDIPVAASCCSLDGDADRIIFFQKNSPPSDLGSTSPPARAITLLDGDRILVLMASYIKELLVQLPAEEVSDIGTVCVQTAYANGMSTRYIEDTLELRTLCVPTGVKHLHAAAHDGDTDIGAYFEANGHGTVLFSERLLEKLRRIAAAPSAAAPSAAAAAESLLLVYQLLNQTCGDGMGGALLVDAILRRKNWSLSDWASLYRDLPSRQSKVCVPDRRAIRTTDAERRCVAPAGLQERIDGIVAEAARTSSSVSVEENGAGSGGNGASASSDNSRDSRGRSSENGSSRSSEGLSDRTEKKEGSAAPVDSHSLLFRAFVRPSGTEDIVRVYAEAPTQTEADRLARLAGEAVSEICANGA